MAKKPIKTAAAVGGPRKLTLSVLRHAKAERGDQDMRDIDRVLTGRGERNVEAMAGWMAQAGLAPNRILCSTSARTRQTLELAVPRLAGAPAVEFLPELYLAGPLVLLKHLHTIKKKDAHVLMIGHNPGLHALALDLIAEGPQIRIAALGRKLPTCGLVVIGFDVKDWTEVVAGTGTLVSFTTPADLE